MTTKKPSERIHAVCRWDDFDLVLDEQAKIMDEFAERLERMEAEVERIGKLQRAMCSTHDLTGAYTVSPKVSTPIPQAGIAGSELPKGAEYEPPSPQPVQEQAMVYGDFYATIRMLEVFAPADPFITDLQTKLGTMSAKLYPGVMTIGQKMAEEVQRIENMKEPPTPQAHGGEREASLIGVDVLAEFVAAWTDHQLYHDVGTLHRFSQAAAKLEETPEARRIYLPKCEKRKAVPQ